MRLLYVGHVGDVLRSGSGKVSIPADDTGEPATKTRGHDH
jgi:hypothetical protein